VSYFRQPRNVGAIENVQHVHSPIARPYHPHPSRRRPLVGARLLFHHRRFWPRANPDANLLANPVPGPLMSAGSQFGTARMCPPGSAPPPMRLPCGTATRCATPSTVIRRSFYENVRRIFFRTSFTPPTVRCGKRGRRARRGACLPIKSWPATGSLRGITPHDCLRSGDNLRDWLRLADVLAARNPAFSRRRFCWAARVTAVSADDLFSPAP